MPSSTNPPANNQIEVSLFGPGVGESVVVHLGSGEWLIVDSCVDRRTGNPVALDYLRALNVPVPAVKLIIATHWHDDHCNGIAALLEAYPSAKLVLSAALRADEFKTLLAASRQETAIGIGELRRALDMIVPAGKAGISERRRLALANRPIFTSQSSQAIVTALSPSDRTVSRAFLEIGELLQHQSQKRRIAAHTENDVAIALWIQCGETRILLGSDLETTSDAERGWLAILNSTEKPHGKATIFKVPHHGSENGDHIRIWQEMLNDNPFAVLTPFRLGIKPLPSPADRERICSRTLHGFATAPTNAPKPHLSQTVERIAMRTAKSLRRLETRMGHIRVRCDGGSTPTVELLGPADFLS